MTSSADAHRELASRQGPVKAAVITVSDTRTPETDKRLEKPYAAGAA